MSRHSLAEPPPRRRVVPAPPPGLCLDFANARYWRGKAVPTDSWPDYGALVGWLRGAAVVDAGAAASLQALGTVDPPAANGLFEVAVTLREALYALFSRLAQGQDASAHLPALNHWLTTASPRNELGVTPEGSTGWRVPMVSPAPGEVLAPVLWSAADLVLAAPRLRLRLRECANDQCRWLFLDDSKSGTRRWCSMSSCGNRHKVQQHALRKAAARAASG